MWLQFLEEGPGRGTSSAPGPMGPCGVTNRKFSGLSPLPYPHSFLLTHRHSRTRAPFSLTSTALGDKRRCPTFLVAFMRHPRTLPPPSLWPEATEPHLSQHLGDVVIAPSTCRACTSGICPSEHRKGIFLNYYSHISLRGKESRGRGQRAWRECRRGP